MNFLGGNCTSKLIKETAPVKIANTIIGAGAGTSASIGAIIVDNLANILQMPIAVPAKIGGNNCAFAR